MSLWTERFDAAPVWTAVGEARARVNQLVVDPADQGQQDVLAYVGMAIELLERRRNESEKSEIVPSMLEATNAAVANWNADLQAVLDGSIVLPAVVGTTDGVLGSFASWPPLKPAKYVAGIQAAVETFSAKVKEVLADVDTRYAGSARKLVELETEEGKLRAAVESETELIAAALAKFEVDSKQSLTDAITESRAALDNTVAEQSEKGAGHIASLEAHEKTAKDTVHATTAWVVATDYGKYARNKTVAAWLCDVAAALVGAAGLAVILYHLSTYETSSDVGISLTRLSSSLGTIGIAALVGRRGAQHHKEARAAKRTDLALRRVGPFITNLPQEEQQEIILDLTERVFIRGDLDVIAPEESTNFRDRISRIRAARRDRETGTA